MTLEEAVRSFVVPGLEVARLEGQEQAFQRCMWFLEGIGKADRQCRKHSGALKHYVENPSGNFGTLSSQEHYFGYIYEGTLILAALASGFTMSQYKGEMRATFNISETDLRRRARAIVKSGKAGGTAP